MADKVLKMVSRLPSDKLFALIEQMASELESRLVVSDAVPVPDSAPVTAVRTKADAKANEDRDVDNIIKLLNDSAAAKGEEMRRAFHDKLGKTITCARRANKSGGRSAHYDFEVQVEDGTWLKVEHKGSAKFGPINPDMPPWKEGVQFYNGGLEKYRITKKYAAAWYDKYIGSGVLKEKYGLAAAIPTLDEWVNGDARPQGDPKTAFGKELKRVVRASLGTSLVAERDEFVEEFYAGCTDVDCTELAEDVLPLARDCLAEKEVWLQIAGDVELGEFNFAWSPGFTITEVKRVQIKKATDILISVECNDGFTFGGILRWGKGMGFSNLRLDLK
jgi:hypothetical protein